MKTLAEFMKGRRAGVKLHRGRPEQKVQDQILLTLRLRGLFAFPLRNHGLFNAKSGHYNKVEKFHVSGVPDIAVILPRGHIFWFEIKAANGRQSDDQIKVEERMRALGHDYRVARSVEDVLGPLRDGGWII